MICYRVYAKLIFLVSLVENLFFPLLYRCYCWICVCCWSSICWNFFFPLLLDVQSIIVWILMIPFDSLFNIFIWYYIYLICFLFLVFIYLFIYFLFFEFDGATINLFFLIIVGCALFCSIVVALWLSCNFFFPFFFCLIYCSY